jgi:putative transcription antitermination factor YqgF
MRLLGIDYGTKHTGIALGVDSATTPLKSISTTSVSYLIEEIGKIIKDEKIDGIVIGVPKNADKKQEQIVGSFVNDLKDNTGTQIYLVDETSTSKESFEENFEKHSKIKKQKEKIHALSAEKILQRFYLENSIG